MTLAPQGSCLGFLSHRTVRIPDSKDGGWAALSLLRNELPNLVYLLSLLPNKEIKSRQRNSSREKNVMRLRIKSLHKELATTTR